MPTQQTISVQPPLTQKVKSQPLKLKMVETIGASASLAMTEKHATEEKAIANRRPSK